MRVLFCFLILAMLGCQDKVASSQSTIEHEESNGIVGGEDVPEDNIITRQALNFKIRYQRSPVDGVEQKPISSQCTASAIAPSVILTAAHCIISNSPPSHMILLKNNQGESISIRGTDVVVHPDYITGNKNADVALILLEQELPKDIEIMNLPEKDADLHLTQVIAAGYGRSDGRPAFPGHLGVLRTATLDVQNYVTTSTSFIVTQNQGKGFCQGDSGGPAIASIDNKTYVVGIASRTFFNPEVPAEERNLCIDRGLYINVQFYADWIQKNRLSLLTKKAVAEGTDF
ncbi:S1 family peptidase [Bdellovibrio sp. HCB-162]|uniref:S1 family peptidase n=1 Tax=Bdellovibrio sp. HCB-162 TaxID=3394234 RepID=UPI0039BD3BB1